MEGISSFLLKYAKLGLSPLALQREMARLIKEALGVEVDPKELVRQKGVLYLHTHPLVKGEIFMHKEKILEAFKSLPVSVREIR